MKWYLARLSYMRPSIVQVDVLKEEGNHIWVKCDKIDGTHRLVRRDMFSESECFFPTMEEAQNCLIQQMEQRVVRAEMELRRHRKNLEEVEHKVYQTYERT